MPDPGRQVKPPGQRRRRNVNEGPKWKTLPAESGREAPPLPEREAGWSDRTLEWWQTIWASPMAALWLPADMGALHDLAELRQQFQDGQPVTSGIRALEDRLGLSPKARQMLAWQVPTDGVVAPKAEPDVESPAAATRATVHRLRAVDPGA